MACLEGNLEQGCPWISVTAGETLVCELGVRSMWDPGGLHQECGCECEQQVCPAVSWGNCSDLIPGDAQGAARAPGARQEL